MRNMVRWFLLCGIALMILGLACYRAMAQSICTGACMTDVQRDKKQCPEGTHPVSIAVTTYPEVIEVRCERWGPEAVFPGSDIPTHISAQPVTDVHIYADAQVGAMPNAYVYPIGEFGIGVEAAHSNWLMRTQFNYNVARKVETRDGHEYQVHSNVWYGKTVLVGGGLDWAKQVTSKYTKDTVHPTAGIGFRLPYMLTYVDLVIPAKDPNGLIGPRWTTLVPISSHFRFRADLAAYSFYPTNQPKMARNWISDSELGFEFVF